MRGDQSFHFLLKKKKIFSSNLTLSYVASMGKSTVNEVKLKNEKKINYKFG